MTQARPPATRSRIDKLKERFESPDEAATTPGTGALEAAQEQHVPSTAVAATRPKKRQLNTYIGAAADEAMKNAIIATMTRNGGYQRIAHLVEAAIWDKIDALQREFNQGEPFPQRPMEVPSGPAVTR